MVALLLLLLLAVAVTHSRSLLIDGELCWYPTAVRVPSFALVVLRRDRSNVQQHFFGRFCL